MRSFDARHTWFIPFIAAVAFLTVSAWPTQAPAEESTTESSKSTSQDASPPPTTPPPKDAPSREDDTSKFSLEHRRELYRKSKLSPWAAAGWTLLLPGLGNLYAEQYLLAGLGFVSFTFSGSFLAYGYAIDDPALQIIGYSFAGIGYGGGLATSLIGVQRYNRYKRQSLDLHDEMARRLPSLRPIRRSEVIFNLNFRF